VHREAGKYAVAQAVDYLALVGDFASEVAAGAIMAGLESERVRIFPEKKDVASWIEELLLNGKVELNSQSKVKVIELSSGDSVEIYATKDKLEFRFYCDGTVNFFYLTKEEIEDLFPLSPIRKGVQIFRK
jgi:dihydroorotase-like cyclic amidohydrolase